MTAHAVKGFRERCAEAGMDGYIAKPVQPDELFETLSSISANAPCANAREPDMASYFAGKNGFPDSSVRQIMSEDSAIGGSYARQSVDFRPSTVWRR